MDGILLTKLPAKCVIETYSEGLSIDFVTITAGFQRMESKVPHNIKNNKNMIMHIYANKLQNRQRNPHAVQTEHKSGGLEDDTQSLSTSEFE